MRICRLYIGNLDVNALNAFMILGEKKNGASTNQPLSYLSTKICFIDHKGMALNKRIPPIMI